MALFDTVNLAGVPIAGCTTEEFLNSIIAAAAKPQPNPLFITYLNAWCSNLSEAYPDYLEILRNADCVYADGQAVVWATRLLGAGVPERVNAGDFALQFAASAAQSGVTVFMVGSEDGIANGAAKAFQAAAPGLNIAGAESGYFQGDGEDIIQRISEACPDILLVGLGVPRQERWAYENRHRFNARVIWCVGALFEYYSGARGRAPVWVRKIGMEWAFRLVLEPKRLWRRYLAGNIHFIVRMLKEYARKKPVR